ncbi:MAG: sugar ABC transporter permease [Anaerolineales bacterium]
MIDVARRERQRTMQGLAFASPWVIGFLIFTVYPLLASAYYSLTRYDVIRAPKFVGLENYVEIFTADPLFRLTLANTVYFVVIGVPAAFVTAWLIANLLNQEMWGRSVWRTVFFLPAITPIVASVMVWLWIYNTQFGIINGALIARGLPAIPFLSSPKLAKPSIILVQCWASGNSVVIFLASLQDVPRQLYEAATIDGANAWARFWKITIPMCTPQMLFVLLTDLIGTFQSFTLPWLLTEGGPNNATELYSLYLFRNAFVFFKMGYASALAWILFLIIGLVSFAIFRSSARWVFYRGE